MFQNEDDSSIQFVEAVQRSLVTFEREQILIPAKQAFSSDEFQKLQLIKVQPNTICTICQEYFTEKDCIAKKFPQCTHVFHEFCLNIQSTYSNKCPLCRVSINSEVILNSTEETFKHSADIYIKLRDSIIENEKLKHEILEQTKEKEDLRVANTNQRKEINSLEEKLKEVKKRYLESEDEEITKSYKNVFLKKHKKIATDKIPTLTSKSTSIAWKQTKYKSSDLKDFNVESLIRPSKISKSYSPELLNELAKKVFNEQIKMKEAFLTGKKMIPYSTLYDRVKLLEENFEREPKKTTNFY